LKKLLWTVGVLLVLLVAGVLIGPGLVDWNQYKGDIQAQAKNATGRASPSTATSRSLSCRRRP